MLIPTLLACALCAAPSAPASDTVPVDTYADGQVEVLLDRARRARTREIVGIESYEARVWERVQAGLTGSRFRRERSLWAEERAATIRWEAGGDRFIQWEGARRASPIAGLRSDQDAGMAQELANSLANLHGGSSPVFYRPGDDRIMFGSGQWALHPLADTAGHHYRYTSGDTLRVTLPGAERTITLAEVRVQPRRSDPRLVAGSLWFEEEGAELVRASYRPARPIYLATETPGADDAEDAPRVLRSLQLEIRQVTVDYSLWEMEWWLPHRFALTLELRAGQLIRVPAGVEWQMGDYRINEAPTPELVAQEAPEGWTRTERRAPDRSSDAQEGDSVRVVNLVPPAGMLHLSPELAPRDDWRAPGLEPRVFADRELRELREELDRILPPTTVFMPRFAWGLEDGLLRYNRVEGLSVGVAGETPLVPGWSARAEFRMGVADQAPLAEARVRRGSESHHQELTVFRRLSHTSDWDDPLDLSSSVSALATGRDRGEYYRTHGVETTLSREVGRGEAQLRLFAEGHRSVERNTDFHLTGLFNDDTLRANRPAEEGTWYGGALELRGHGGLDPEGLRVFGALRSETARGPNGWYQRASASGGGVRGLGPVELGLEVGAGSGWGALPPQREFYLGGPSTVRGIRPSSLVGESFWFARGEVARGRPAARLAFFGDLGWAGPRADFGSGRPVRVLGVGASLLDGFVRMDLARRLGEGGAWRFHVYLDGVL